MRKHQVYVRVPRSQCWAETGKAPLKTGWAETNKGSKENPNVRCRWVGKEIRTGPRPDLYAPTPPYEALKMVLSRAATGEHRKKAIAIIDVRRAYFYAPAKRRVFVELPPEDWVDGDEDRCGLLLKSLYGTRDAALNWDEELGNSMVEIGMKRGRASSCVYTHPKRG